jgi:hypothetical protein
VFVCRRFLLKTQLAIPDDLRKEVNRHIKEGKELLAGDVFDGVQAEVENLINETTYPNFLKSDMYLQHVQAMQNGELSSGSTSSSGSSGSSSGGGRDLSGGGPPLPTLHEDAEFVTEMGSVGCRKLPAIGQDVLPLTRDMLMATQKRRAFELRPKPEAYAGYVACIYDVISVFILLNGVRVCLHAVEIQIHVRMLKDGAFISHVTTSDYHCESFSSLSGTNIVGLFSNGGICDLHVTFNLTGCLTLNYVNFVGFEILSIAFKDDSIVWCDTM